MSSKFAPESLLALRQVVDEKVTTEDVELILEALQISDKENIPKELVANFTLETLRSECYRS